MTENLSYEQALEELQSIMQELQEESVGVDDLTEKSERATELIQYCKSKLRGIESSMEKLFPKD